MGAPQLFSRACRGRARERGDGKLPDAILRRGAAAEDDPRRPRARRMRAARRSAGREREPEGRNQRAAARQPPPPARTGGAQCRRGTRPAPRRKQQPGKARARIGRAVRP